MQVKNTIKLILKNTYRIRIGFVNIVDIDNLIGSYI